MENAKPRYHNLEDLKKDLPEFGQELEDLIKDTKFEITGFFCESFKQGELAIHVLFIEHEPGVLSESSDLYNTEAKIVEDRLYMFADGGNPEPKVIWFFGDGIITITGYC